MGAGFWIIQATFAIAAIGTAVQAERQRRREGESDLPRVKVPVQAGGLAQFTLLEQSRLLLLRRFVQEARVYKNHLYDDLAPDASEPPVSHDPRTPARRSWTWHAALLGLGLLLLGVGLIGIVRTSSQMDEVDNQLQSAHSPLLTRLLPGLIANPARFLATVNSSGSSSSVGSGADPFATAKMLDLRRNMDRFEALFGFGVVSLLLYTARSPARSDPDAPEQTSIGRDLIPLVGLLATVCGLLSFFELP